MPLTKHAALEILGLPSFASDQLVILRYKYLALEWFPENHNRSQTSVEVFRNITRATLTLTNPIYPVKGSLDLETMYHFFHHIFFGGHDRHDHDLGECCECDRSECSGCSVNPLDDFQKACEEEMEAEDKATQLIWEEEQEKINREKRRAKKKRRKERKKLEKEEKPIKVEKLEEKEKPKKDEVPKQNQSNVSKDKSKASKTKKPKKLEILKSDSDEDLDPSSAFVSVVARKHKKLFPDLQIKDEIVIPTNHYVPDIDNEDDPEVIILKAREFALQGNAKANAGLYLEAIESFSESIKLDPSDHRFYGNRSYCYDRLNMYDKAMKDADKSIKLCPVWAKGYYRKGRALLGLKKFALAEKFFVEVLKLDNDCVDAISELRKAKLYQIMEKGYPKEIAEAGLSRCGSVTDTLASLIAMDVARVEIDSDIFISDDEVECAVKPQATPNPTPPPPTAISVQKPQTQTKPLAIPRFSAQDPFYDIKMDPKNPEGHNSIWIGNVQPEVSEKKLVNMFGKFGDLISVRVMPEKFCAFVNYKTKTSPGKAMETYQGYELNGKGLVIRFPNLPGQTSAPTVKKSPGVIGQELKKLGPVNGNECYFWRTTGCVYGELCRYQHIKEHKGVDKKGWQVV